MYCMDRVMTYLTLTIDDWIANPTLTRDGTDLNATRARDVDRRPDATA
jgi:hypothetical protein